jgi:hypothetical protein
MCKGATADMKCKFYEKCSFADSESATCTQESGGKYRLLQAGLSMHPMVSKHTVGKQTSGKPSKKTPC